MIACAQIPLSTNAPVLDAFLGRTLEDWLTALSFTTQGLRRVAILLDRAPHIEDLTLLSYSHGDTGAGMEGRWRRHRPLDFDGCGRRLVLSVASPTTRPVSGGTDSG
jgi:hypothetical protein